LRKCDNHVEDIREGLGDGRDSEMSIVFGPNLRTMNEDPEYIIHPRKIARVLHQAFSSLAKDMRVFVSKSEKKKKNHETCINDKFCDIPCGNIRNLDEKIG
jgi:hypothetical protein